MCLLFTKGLRRSPKPAWVQEILGDAAAQPAAGDDEENEDEGEEVGEHDDDEAAEDENEDGSDDEAAEEHAFSDTDAPAPAAAPAAAVLWHVGWNCELKIAERKQQGPGEHEKELANPITIPEGACRTLTPVSTLFTFCPPAPPLLKVSQDISAGLILISIVSSTSGYTYTEAKEVIRLPCALNGLILTNL